jgi:hypothetical protein
MKLLMLTAIFLVAGTGARAQMGNSAEWLASYCDGQMKPSVTPEGTEATQFTTAAGYFCAGFFHATTQLLMARGLNNKLCAPDSLSLTEVFLLFTEFLKRHPEQSSWPATGVVWNAFQDKWPCRVTNRR